MDRLAAAESLLDTRPRLAKVDRADRFVWADGSVAAAGPYSVRYDGDREC